MVIRKGYPASFVRGKWITALASLLFILLVFSSSARAHKVSLFAWVEGDTVYTESYFGGERKASGGLIRVFDPSGRQILEGKTDESGAFSFRIPQKTDLKIVLEATMGHRTEFLLSAADLGAGPAEAEEATVGKGEEPAKPAPVPAAVDEQQIRRIMEEVLDARLKPITRSLARIQQDKGPGPTEIIGGIGYIFGLMGVALYFMARKRDRIK